MRTIGRLGLVLALLGIAGAAPAQDSNILLPVDSIERLLAFQDFQVLDRADTRFEGDRTQRVILMYPDSFTIAAKWAKAPPGGQAFNNQPRYELAAYQLQKLFLEPDEYVVPPTVARGIPVDLYREWDPRIAPTFGDTRAVLVVLQYWLFNVTSQNPYDRDRLAADSVYARHFGNLNVLTYLIKHSDANAGNVLISNDPTRPRVFTVDNGVSFAGPESDRGTEWRDLRAERISARTVERLRQIDREVLDRVLGVVAQFEIRDGQLYPVPPGENLSRNRGIRVRGDVVQLGLTAAEIRQVHGRLEGLLRRIDSGRIQTF